MNKKKYKLSRQIYDIRDNNFHNEYTQLIDIKLPDKINLHDLIQLPILDQEDLGSCTANVSSNAILFYLKQHKKLEYQPSRLYIYYFSRLLENSINDDSGCNIRDVLKAISKYGACDELLYPYKIKKFKNKPPNECIIDAKNRIHSFQYLSVNQNLNSIKNCLYRGYPIILGIEIFDSFEDENTLNSGDVQMPNIQTEKNLGMHCILLTGYDDNNKIFIFQNSWGFKCGINGFFNIPYNYLLSNELATDFWIIDLIK